MTRDADLAGSREGLLRNGDQASRLSNDEEYESGSDIDLDELDSPDDQSPSPTLRGGWKPIKRRKKAPGKELPGLPSKRKGGWLRNKAWMLITAILVGGLVGVLGALYGGVFKKPAAHAPLDGVSHPTA